MSSVPWANEAEKTDYYQKLYNEQLAICDRLDRHLQRYIEDVRRLERERDDILADTQAEVSERLEAEIKAEAYKEFAERLDKEFSGVGTCNYGYVHHKTRKVLKELVGEDK